MVACHTPCAALGTLACFPVGHGRSGGGGTEERGICWKLEGEHVAHALCAFQAGCLHGQKGGHCGCITAAASLRWTAAKHASWWTHPGPAYHSAHKFYNVAMAHHAKVTGYVWTCSDSVVGRLCTQKRVPSETSSETGQAKSSQAYTTNTPQGAK